MFYYPLLARGRDRLETRLADAFGYTREVNPLLARGRDRLETLRITVATQFSAAFPYSLGDAIDWKQSFYQLDR